MIGGAIESKQHGAQDDNLEFVNVGCPRGSHNQCGEHASSFGPSDALFHTSGGRLTTFGRDGYGRVTTVTPAEGATRTTYYDVLNRIDSIQDGVSTKAIRFARGESYATTTDPEDQVYRTDVNALSWPVSVQDPTAEADSFAYDSSGVLRQWKNRRGSTTSYTYDAALRPLTAGNDNFSYNATGRILKASNAYVTDSTFLNARGDPVVSKTYFAELDEAFTISRYYNNEGILDSTTVSGGGESFLKRTYDFHPGRGTLDGITLNTAQTTIDHEDDLQLKEYGLPSSITVEVSRTSGNTVSALESSAAYGSTTDRQAGYDDAYRVEMQLQLDNSTGHRYGYDGLGRLLADTTITFTPANCTPASDDGYGCSSWTYQGHQSFSYDDVGNREDNGGDYDTGNRITDFLSCTYTTDDDGNVTSEQCASDTTNYTWDAQNRLTQVTHDGNTYNLRYDALGRLGRLDLGGSPYRYFLWDGDDLVAELDSDGDVLLEYSYYPGMDNLHAVEKGGTVYYAHRDIGGNVIALTTGTTLSRTYQYSPWGANTGGSDNASFNGTDRARWKGALWFPELNHNGGLYYMRARWYQPLQGRFLSEDPIGLQGGINPYVFVANSPVNGRDPEGLDLMYFSFLGMGMDCYAFGGALACYPFGLDGISTAAGGGDRGSGMKHGKWGLRGRGGGLAGSIYSVFGGTGDVTEEIKTFRETHPDPLLLRIASFQPCFSAGVLAAVTGVSDVGFGGLAGATAKGATRGVGEAFNAVQIAANGLMRDHLAATIKASNKGLTEAGRAGSRALGEHLATSGATNLASGIAFGFGGMGLADFVPFVGSGRSFAHAGRTCFG